MNSIVEELYEQFFKMPEDFYNREKVEDSSKHLAKISQELLKEIPEDKKALFDAYENALNFHNSLEIIETFRQGIKIGFYLHKELDD